MMTLALPRRSEGEAAPHTRRHARQ